MKNVEFVFERKINYYETDKMGVVHHSNYIRFLEEARTAHMDAMGLPYSKLEEKNIIIPVISVKCIYKAPSTFDDILVIKINITDVRVARMTVSYVVTNKATGDVVLEAETQHCFTDPDIKPINLKKHFPEAYEMFLDNKILK